MGKDWDAIHDKMFAKEKNLKEHLIHKGKEHLIEAGSDEAAKPVAAKPSKWGTLADYEASLKQTSTQSTTAPSPAQPRSERKVIRGGGQVVVSHVIRGGQRKSPTKVMKSGIPVLDRAKQIKDKRAAAAS